MKLLVAPFTGAWIEMMSAAIAWGVVYCRSFNTGMDWYARAATVVATKPAAVAPSRGYG